MYQLQNEIRHHIIVMDCTLAAEGLARDARSSSRLVAGEGGGWGKLQIFVSVNMSVKGL